MSFLSRRKPHRHRDSPHADLGTLIEDDAASMQAPSLLQTPSIRSMSNLRKRLSGFSLLASMKRGRSHAPQPQTGVGFAPPFHMESRSRSPSPEPSLEIRRPSGLGRRASVIDLLDHPEQGMYATGERKRSISTPELTMLPNGLLKWSHLPPKRARPETPPPLPPPKPGAIFAGFPGDLLAAVFSFAAPADVASAALVCRSFVKPARAVLYDSIDLVHVVTGNRAEKCVNLLASRRDLGELVHHFVCDAIPSSNDPLCKSTYSVVTFAIALNNMPSLSTLTLPRFDASLLAYTSFRLKNLTFLCERMSNQDIRSAFEWLKNQPTLISLSFPKLVLDDSNWQFLSSLGSQRPPSNGSHDNIPAPLMLSPQLLPALVKLCGPTSLVAVLAPGRPLTSVQLHVHSTIYDGLRPSEVASGLSKCSSPVSHLIIVTASHARIDARTMERLLMPIGSELGSAVQVLEIESLLEDEVLRKHIGPVLPRYKVLHTLRLHRKSFPLPSTPPPTPLPGSPLHHSLACESSSSPSPHQGCSDVTHPPRASERAILATWSRHCDSLRTVMFPSGAEWSVTAASFTLIGMKDAVA